MGDIVVLNAGDRVPSDGILVEGSDVTCNESALTGESDDRKKENVAGGDVFLLSGTNLSTGYAHMLVVAVGENSKWGKTKAKLAVETTDTPLQEKLDVLAGQIGNFGMFAAGATFVAMMIIRYFNILGPATDDLTFFEYVLKAFIMAVTIVVVAVPEGLPLAVTLSLAYSTQKMMKDNNLIRVLAACETMGNATNICSDKTGTLTQNRMTVVRGWICGQYYEKVDNLKDFNKDVQALIAEGISVNSTANLMYEGSNLNVVGNKTEGALLLFIKNLFGLDYVPLRKNFLSERGDRLITFSSARKRMSVVLRNDVIGKGSGIVYTKGASEVILERCKEYITRDGQKKPLDQKTRNAVSAAIDEMAKNALRTVALAHKQLKQVSGEESADDLENDLVLQAIVGIEDPLRPDVVDAVRTCQEAGIFVRMVTGDNIETARAIARQCGILTDEGIAMEGPDFRKLTPAQLDAILPKLQVLARSSPDDKHTLVTRLNGKNLPENEEEWKAVHKDCDWNSEKDKLLPGYRAEWEKSHVHGEVVGVTGDGTNDGPAMKAADVGLSMGLSGTDVAKEASDIVILDDNFSSIVKSVMWGRSVFDNIRKFLQFQLTVNAVALTLTFFSALSGKEPPLNAVMMLWVNLIMDTMGALALGTEPPSKTLLTRKPYKRDASLINNQMWRNIFIQFLFQMSVLIYLILHGAEAFNVKEDSREHLTIIFNTFVFCQVFNELNARSITNNFNIFDGLQKNLLFVAIIMFTVFAQFFIVELGGEFVRTVPLNSAQWYKCILIGALSLPVGAMMRLLPIENSEDDFAELSPVLENARNQTKSTKSKKELAKEEATGFSLTFLLWIGVVGSIISLAAKEFLPK